MIGSEFIALEDWVDWEADSDTLKEIWL